jgi:hypothetical protein
MSVQPGTFWRIALEIACGSFCAPLELAGEMLATLRRLRSLPSPGRLRR